MNTKLIIFLLVNFCSQACAVSPRLESDEIETRAGQIAQNYIGMAKFAEKRMYKEAALHAVGQRYVRFLEQFGAEDSGDIKELMASLFADDCQKVVNGKIITQNVQELYNQMAQAKEVVGTWSVRLMNPTVVTVDTNMIVIHYEIPTQHIGTFVVMKFLTVDNGFITEINEVYNMLEATSENLHQITE